jgi:hypothetical protein
MISTLIRRGLYKAEELYVDDDSFHDVVIASLLISTAFEQEREELRNSIELGLLDSSVYRAALRFLLQKYNAKIQNDKKSRVKGRIRQPRSQET